MKSNDDYWCIFLDSKKKCNIYPVRPSQCITFPYWKNIVDNIDSIKNIAKQCPGVTLIK